MTLKFTILGCGSSMGVPTATNNWGNCNPNEKKKHKNQMFSNYYLKKY